MKYISFKCLFCNKVKSVYEKCYKDRKPKYCSYSCRNKGNLGGRSGEGVSNWKGGKNIHNGYVRLRIDGKDFLEHRIVMEKHLGRKLTSKEHIHHINHNRSDNIITNLKLMTISEHMYLERKLSPHLKDPITGKFISHI